MNEELNKALADLLINLKDLRASLETVNSSLQEVIDNV